MVKLIIIILMSVSFLAVAEQNDSNNRQPNTATHNTYHRVDHSKNADMQTMEHDSAKPAKDQEQRADHSGLDPRY